jgi:Domain of unknown function (DUF4331)
MCLSDSVVAPRLGDHCTCGHGPSIRHRQPGQHPRRSGFPVSHHFDSPAARDDSRINLSDNYLFAGSTPETLTAIVAVSPLAGLPSPYHDGLQWRTFRPETAYDLRFDTNGDLLADRVLRLLFAGDTIGEQAFTLALVEGDGSRTPPGGGHVLAEGVVEAPTVLRGGGRIWIGEAGDAFWLDAVAASTLIAGLRNGGPFKPDQFSTGIPTTAGTNTLAVVAELPLDLISAEPMTFWSTVSANDHGTWTQIARCGRPNFAATFIDNPERSTLHNATTPDRDLDLFSTDVTTVVEQLTRAAGTTTDPAGYATLAARALLPDVIPYDPALPVNYGFAGINGRGLRDDFGAQVYSTVFNYPMRTALDPLPDVRDEFPYLPPPRPRPAGTAVAVPSRQQG